MLILKKSLTSVMMSSLTYREDPGSGNLITFAQFLFIAIEGFVTTMNFGRRQIQVPFQ